MTPSPAEPAGGLRVPHALRARRRALRSEMPAAAQPCRRARRALLPSPPGGGRHERAHRSSSCARSPSASQRPLDLAERVARRLGAERQRRRGARGRRRRSRRSARARSWAWSANPAAASRRSGRMVVGHLRAQRRRGALEGRSIARARPRRAARARSSHVQMIFQDPYASLNPRLRVRGHRRRGAAWCTAWSPRARPRRVSSMLTAPRRPRSHATSAAIPHQFSGGQRQRIGIARALAVQARVPGLRRGGGGARRLDPGAGAQSLHASCARSSTSPISSSATISAWSSTSADRVADHVSGPHRRERADRGAVRGSRTIPTPRRCSPRCRASTIAGAASRRSRARSRRRSIRPPAATSIPRCPHAMARCRREAPALREIAPGRHSACHLNERGSSP